MFDQTPDATAYLALALWPLVALALVAWLGPARGVVGTLLGGYLLLPPAPAGLDLPLLPALTKDSVPTLAALLAVALLARPPPGTRLGLLPAHPAARALLALYLLAPWATILANADPVYWGRFALPGLHPREAVGTTLVQLVVVAPLLLGRALLAGEEGARVWLAALMWGGLAYSLPMLLEVRLAPQMNVWVYGFFQHSFEQMMRGDGFRPIVFLYHGLWAAFLAMTAACAALGLMRDSLGAGGRRPVLLGLAGAWMLMVLVLCKSLASLLYAALLAPLILLAPRRLQLAAALGLALLPLGYPVARALHLVPTEAIVALAERAAGPERAFSLKFRLDTEDALLARAAERPVLGWGLWGRGLIHERDTGRQLSVPDGRWIILLGAFGWAGLVGTFGLLALPVGLAARAGPATPPAVAALALILAVNLADLVPNATETPLTWLTAGVLLGWAERRSRVGAPAAPAPARARPTPAFETIL